MRVSPCQGSFSTTPDETRTYPFPQPYPPIRRKNRKIYFLPTKNQIPEMALRKGATYAEFWHEFMHVLDYKRLGAERFVNTPAAERELMAFERFIRTPMWKAIALEERQFLWDYLVKYWGVKAPIPRPVQ